MNKHTLALIVAIAVLLVIVGLASWLTRRKPSKLNKDYFGKRWHEAQALCGHEETWPLAIINADKLVDEALKKSKYHGKTMGERLISAEKDIQDKDGVWFAHKLRNKLVHEEHNKLKKKEVMDALLGFRAALKDLGAL